MKLLNAVFLLSAVGLALWRSEAPKGKAQGGTLQLSTVDAASGKPTPARVELLDKEGKGHVAEDALPTGGD